MVGQLVTQVAERQIMASMGDVFNWLRSLPGGGPANALRSLRRTTDRRGAESAEEETMRSASVHFPLVSAVLGVLGVSAVNHRSSAHDRDVTHEEFTMPSLAFPVRAGYSATLPASQ